MSNGSGTGTPISIGIVLPTTEPITLQELKEYIRLNSGNFADNLTTIQSIAPASHAITVGYTLIGAYVDVLGFSSVVMLDSGANGATGTVDAKIQESDDHVTWTDWAGGAFTQITTANDNAIYEKEYTGAKQYIRVVAKVLLAACSFGVSISTYASNVTEDALLASLITSARQYAETLTRRQFITATFDMFLDAFPSKREIKIPYGQLQSVASVKYKTSEGVETTMTAGSDYLVDTTSDHGRIVLPTGKSWASFIPYPLNPITIRFICGYGLPADVPAGIKTAIKMIAAGMYENRESQGTQQLYQNKTASFLLAPYRLWGFV